MIDEATVGRPDHAPGHGSQLLPGELAPPPPSPPRSARGAQIVAAARQILEDDGPSALTMRRLAEELGIQAPSLYKHFASKQAVEAALVEDALREVGEISHRAIQATPATAIAGLFAAYRSVGLANPNLYRLATSGPLDRAALPVGLEEWAGNPWYLVSGNESLAQALWSFAHGMVALEIDGRYPPGSDLEATWRAGAEAFTAMTRGAARHSPGGGAPGL
jgi:AcrR family transcriptional regulator